VHVAKASLNVWHKWLGHVMTHSVKKLLELSTVTGIELTDDRTNHVDGEYIACIKEKITQNIIPKRSDVENPRRLHRIYSDICEPFCHDLAKRLSHYLIFLFIFISF